MAEMTSSNPVFAQSPTLKTPSPDAAPGDVSTLRRG